MLNNARQQLLGRKLSSSPTASPRRPWRRPWGSDQSGQFDLDVAVDDNGRDDIIKVGKLMADDEHAAAFGRLQELISRYHDRHDPGVQLLFLAMREVVNLHAAYRRKDMAAWANLGPLSSLAVPHRASSASHSPMMSVREDADSPLGPSVAAEVQQLREQLRRIHEVTGQAATDAAGRLTQQLLVQAATDAGQLVELLHSMFETVWSPLLQPHEHFLSARSLVQQLRSLHKSLGLASASSLFRVPLSQLVTEVELLEALVSCEYKVSLLKANDAFVELMRAQHLLDKYKHRGAESSGAQSAVDATSSGVSGPPGDEAPGHASPAEFGGLARAHSAASMSMSMSMSMASALPVAAEGEAELCPLVRWLVQFHAHCASKLVLLCGGGLMAAASFSARQVLDPYSKTEPQSKARSLGADTLKPNSTASFQSQGTGHGRHPDVSPNYLQDLRKLASMPGVRFAGVFANARQLPHLACESERASCGGGGSWWVPLQDSVWLMPEPRRAETATAGAGEEWWALAFASCSTRAAVGANTAAPGGGVASSEGTAHIGLEALEACRYKWMAELQCLRGALGNACHERHAVSRASGGDTPGTTAQGPSNLLRSTSLGVTSSAWAGMGLPLSAASQGSMASHVRDTRRRSYAGGRMYGIADLSPLQNASGALPDPQESPLTSRPVNMPNPPRPTCVSVVETEAVASVASAQSAAPDQGAKCLILPLDLGWFPSPVFLGVAFCEPKTATSNVGSPVLTEGASRRRAKSSQGAAPAPAPTSAPTERRAGMFGWLASLFKEGPPGSPEGHEDVLAAVEREMLALALAASGKAPERVDE